MGLPNNGFDFYSKFVAHLHENNKQSAKPLFFSMSGLSAEENVAMCKQLLPLASNKQIVL